MAADKGANTFAALLDGWLNNPLDELERLGLVDDEDIVVDDAALLLSQLAQTDTDLAPYRALIGSIVLRLSAISAGASSAHQQAVALSQVLGGEFGFTGVTNCPSNQAIDFVHMLQLRRGPSVTLAILYAGVARRVGWQPHVIDITDRMLVAVGGEAAPVFIDVQDGRVIVSGQLAVASSGPDAARYATTLSNRDVLVRLLMQEAARAEQIGEGDRAFQMYRRANVLAPAYNPACLKLARLQFDSSNAAAAARRLVSILETCRKPPLRYRVIDTIMEVRLCY